MVRRSTQSFPYCRHMASGRQPSAEYKNFAVFLGSTTITIGPALRSRATSTQWRSIAAALPRRRYAGWTRYFPLDPRRRCPPRYWNSRLHGHLIRKDVANRWALQPDRRNQPLYDRRVAGLDSFRRCVLAPIKVFQFCTVVPCRVVFDRLDLKLPARAEHRSLEDSCPRTRFNQLTSTARRNKTSCISSSRQVNVEVPADTGRERFQCVRQH
jgi:hypothetical protein